MGVDAKQKTPRLKARPHADRSRLIRVLRAAGTLLPGNYLKTAFHRTLIAKPRRALRRALNGFYRIDQIYDVLEEATAYAGELSILEFGTHHGYAFTKMLYATKYLGLEDRVAVHSFDSFEGLPPAADIRDQNVVTDEEVFAAGQYRGDYEALEQYCQSRYHNYAIHRGYFEDVLSPELLDVFRKQLPILVWIDCDYYSSARTVMERLVPFIPSGCVVYFDDYRYNYGSRLTGEARVVFELNRGDYGDDIELVIDRKLGLDSDSVYRFIRLEGGPRYRWLTPHTLHQGRRRGNDSALP
jgi:Macrocin-O-methyltransferase (TylF)